MPQLEAQLKQAEASEGSQQKNKLLRTRWALKKSPKWSAAHRHPVSKMMQGERENCCRWKTCCTSAWSARDEAVTLVSDAIRRSRSGLVTNRPYGSFLFLGPPASVAKPAVQNAGDLPVRFGRTPDPHRHERIHGKHSVARLIGAPPAMSAMKKAAI